MWPLPGKNMSMDTSSIYSIQTPMICLATISIQTCMHSEGQYLKACSRIGRISETFLNSTLPPQMEMCRAGFPGKMNTTPSK